MHESVMVDEFLHHFKDLRNGVIIDGTLGCGGHSLKLLDALKGKCKIIGLDQDNEAIERCKKILKKYKHQVVLKHSNFALFDNVLNELNIKKIDGCILDIGVSKNQLVDNERGFSFANDGPLDMRMDQARERNAAEIVNNYTEDELYTIIRTYGEERYARMIARRITQARKDKYISTTQELGDIIFNAYPRRHYHKIHPATRTFQALRIEVNNELENLKVALEKVVRFLNNDGIICVISFHSLEDRIVKHIFRKWKNEGLVTILTKKPLVPSIEEIQKNPRARSAKMRLAKRSLQA